MSKEFDESSVLDWLIATLENQIVLSAHDKLGTKRTGDYRIGLRKAIDFCSEAKEMIDTTCISCDENKETHQVCMDCIVKTNHEISDEEIYKASREHITDGGGAQGWIEAAFRQGAVWYREQLKK